MRIERCVPSDAEKMLEYLRAVGAESDNLSFGGEGIGASVEDEKKFISEMSDSENGILLVVRDGDEIVADASLSRMARRMSHRGELGIAVRREYQNRGLGSRLMAEMLDFARAHDFDSIELEVRSDNKPAIGLYEKFGFRKIGEHPAFFKIDGECIPFDYMYLKL